MSSVFGYIRVSSRDQNEERQLVAMRDKDIPEKNLYIDKLSGKDFNRPSSGAMETVNQGKEGGYLCDRYAASGYTKRKRSDGHVSGGPGSPDFVICGGK